MLCVGPSHLDWNWQKDGEEKCFRHVWMHHLPQRCLVRSQQKPSNWSVLDSAQGNLGSQLRTFCTNGLVTTCPGLKTTGHQRELKRMNALCCHGSSFWVTNTNHSILLYMSFAISSLIRYANHQVLWSFPLSSHYCFVSGGHLVRSHEPFLGNQARGLCWLMLASLIS